MKKTAFILLLAGLLYLILPSSAMADSLGLYFGARQVNYQPQNGVTLTVKAMHAAETDISFRVGDQRGNVYAVTLPKGKSEIQFSVVDGLPQDGSVTFYTLLDGEGYVCRTPGSCAAVPRGATSYTFAEEVYQTYVGREFTLKLRVETPPQPARRDPRQPAGSGRQGDLRFPAPDQPPELQRHLRGG